jgi:quercetin dioxygenase-like cupin family protein
MKDLLPWLLMTALTVSWMLDRTAQAPAAALPAEVVAPAAAPAKDPGQVFRLADLVAQREASGRPYLPFLTVPTLRTGLYVLPAGGVDGQQPHGKDEVYYVIQGRSGMTIDGEAYTVAPGDVIFVAAQAEHRFHDIEEDLHLLVFFSEADPEAAEEK